MTVRGIVANIASGDPVRFSAFYKTLFGLKVIMDQGYIVTLAADTSAPPQISFASDGGSGTQVPDLSIEVDDVDAVYQRAISGRH